MQCFKCLKNFCSSEVLLTHIKITHPFLQRYECMEDNCKRNFPNLNGLRKHLNNHHTSNNSANEVPSCTSIPNVSFMNSDATSETDILLGDKFKKAKNKNLNNDNSFGVTLIAIKNQISNTLASLYSIPSLPRRIVQLFIDSYTEFIKTLFTHILSNYVNEGKYQELKNFCTQVEYLLSSFKSEYLRFKYFTQMESFIKPETLYFGEQSELEQKNIKEQPTMTLKKAEGQKISLALIFKSYLELPGVLNEILNYINEVKQTDIISSVFQGNIWKQLEPQFLNKIVLPIFLYYDDFESSNPLGSKAGLYKIGAVYVSLACLPNCFSGLLDNIFLSELIFANDRVVYGNRAIFENLIIELKDLECNGVSIKTNNGDKTIYFTLLAILGDNLGLNSILGFNESFNSNFFCRLCKTPKDITKRQYCSDPLTYRTLQNYNEDCVTFSYGIKELCIWNDLPHFHVTNNISCDLMHDVLEGTLRYEMAHIINCFIEKNYFSFAKLNQRIKYFKFVSGVDVGNPIPQLKFEHIKKKYIIISATEMMSLAIYFGVIIGDLIPNDDEVWHLHILNYKILDILLSQTISKNTITHLELLIKEHHELYCTLFQECLKPKHHNLLHYPRVISNIGPVRNCWAMRFEAYHKLLKSVAKSVTSRRNILYTICIKNQLKFSYKILSKKGFQTHIEFGSPDHDIFFGTDEKHIRPFIEFPLDQAFLVPWIKISNIEYKIGVLLQLSYMNDEEIEFGSIEYIIMTPVDYYFITSTYTTLGYDEHIQCYEIVADQYSKYKVLSYSALINIFPYSIKYTADGRIVTNCIK